MNQSTRTQNLSVPARPAFERRMQATTLTMLLAIGLVNNLDRSALSIANPLIVHELNLTNVEMGMLLSAFSLIYAFSQLPVGLILDRFGTRLILSAGVILWSGAQVFCGIANSFTQLFIGRALLGVGESPHYPASAKAVSEWFSASQRGRPTSVFLIAGTLAPALAPPLLTGLMLTFGWRWMFVILGATGIALGICWLVFYRNRSQLQAASGATTITKSVSLSEWFGLFRQRNTWAMILGSGGVIYMIWLYMSWLPVYLQNERHVSLTLTGWYAAIPYLLGMLGQVVAGITIDFLSKKGMSVSASRKIPVCGGLVCAGLSTLFAAYTPTLQGSLVGISLSMFFIYFSNVGTWAMVGVMVESRLVATMGSLLTFGGYLGGSVAPVVTGFLVEKNHSFTQALSISSVLTFVAALIFLFGMKLNKKDKLIS